MNLNLDKKIFNEAFYPMLYDYGHRYEVYNGSAGSGKSVFIAQKLIIRCLNERIRILVCRKYGTTIRQTVFANIKDILKQWQLTAYMKINETDYRITFPNGSEMLFTGLDAEEKLLSLTDISCIWIEEAFEVEEEIFTQLNLRMRGRAKNQQLILSFNPISASHWLYNFCEVNPPEGLYYHHSTYKDNKFLTEEYIKALEDLKTRNPTKWQIYGLGMWGTDPEGLVFHDVEVKEIDPYSLIGLEHRAGADIGYIDPSAVIETLYDAESHTIYIINEFYGDRLTLDEIYAGICNLHLQKTKIQFDSAEPRTIDYFKRKGLWAVPCIKGANSVESRIKFLQNQHIVIDPKCKQTVASFQNFSYEKDKKTGKYVEGKYEHTFSHCIDGCCYAYSDLYSRHKMKTIDKSILGL